MKTLLFAIVISISAFCLSSCVNSCPDIACNSIFSGGSVILKGFNLQRYDTITYVQYPKGDLQNPIDSFFVWVEMGGNTGNTANNTGVSLGNKFDYSKDWKIITPTKEEYTLVDIKVFDAICADCTRGHVYYEEYEVKVNGETKTGRIVLTK